MCSSDLLSFAPFAPSITMECGTSMSKEGMTRAFKFLRKVLSCEDLSHAGEPVNLNLYEAVMRLELPEGASIGFDQHGSTDFVLRSDIESMNFVTLKEDIKLGTNQSKKKLVVETMVSDVNPSDYFVQKGQDIILRKGVMPSMLTRNSRVIADDCICYFLERV